MCVTPQSGQNCDNGSAGTPVEAQMHEDKKLAGQVAVVTGGGRGIGAAISRRLAALGATAVVAGRSRAPLQATASAICDAGGRAEPWECDVTDLASVEALAAHVEQTYGRLDMLVNNAGIRGAGGLLHTTPPANWDEVINTNLRGVYYCIRACAPMMIRARSGHIINISSIAGKNALPGSVTYATSKWGLNGLSYSVAEELRSYNVREMLTGEDVAYVVAMLVTQAPQSFASEIILRPTQKP
jgi:NAD(P)-dependent dehydrogenase (short-subunit alcohol dehydrogenase family)